MSAERGTLHLFPDAPTLDAAPADEAAAKRRVWQMPFESIGADGTRRCRYHAAEAIAAPGAMCAACHLEVAAFAMVMEGAEDEHEERNAIVAECAPGGGDPTIAVLSAHNRRAWPRHAEGGAARPTRLSAALARRYRTDAHLVQYEATAIGRRLDLAAVDHLDKLGGPIRMVSILFDVDAPNHGAGVDMVAWWESERAKVQRLGTFSYRTRHGYRVAFFLPLPFEIASHEDAEGWRNFYLASCAYLWRAHGIAADPVGDWPRLFRAPHATRDGSSTPEEHETIGDPAALGPWLAEIAAEDIAFAATTLRRRESEGRKARGERPASDYQGDGLLYHLFRGLGALGPCLDPAEGKFAVLCPRDAEHAKRGLDGSTVFYTPRAGGEVGWLHCSHTSHGHDRWTLRDVLGLFSAFDIEQARRLAGITRRAAA